MAQRTCGMPGCERKHVARGLCGSHCNKTRYTEEQRHPKREVACTVCGTKVLRRMDKARVDRHCCSPECRAVRQWGEYVGGKQYEWEWDAAKRARDAGCEVIEDVRRDEVLARDEWRCYLCGIDTSLTSDPFSPASATVDHVVPLSKGGEHSMRNVRCCCLGCNSSKSNRNAPGAAA